DGSDTKQPPVFVQWYPLHGAKPAKQVFRSAVDPGQRIRSAAMIRVYHLNRAAIFIPAEVDMVPEQQQKRLVSHETAGLEDRMAIAFRFVLNGEGQQLFQTREFFRFSQRDRKSVV